MMFTEYDVRLHAVQFVCLKQCCLARQWNDSNMGDEAKANARDLKHSAEQKGREIRDSWR
jgi:hypothetical protein